MALPLKQILTVTGEHQKPLLILQEKINLKRKEVIFVGHYWREIDPQGAEAHDRRINREVALKKELDHLTLDNFKVSDLRALLNLLGFNKYGGATQDELELLEAKVNGIKAAQKLNTEGEPLSRSR